MSDWSGVQRLLAVRLDAMGDVLMTTPALRALQEQNPQRHITLLTSPSGAELGGMLPDVDAVLAYESPWMKASQTRTDPEPDWDLIRRLQAQRFDGAVIFTVFSQNPLPAALLCYLAGIPLRAAHCRENPYQLLSDWVPEVEPEKGIRHEVERQLALCAALGAPPPSDRRLRLSVPEDVRRRVAAAQRRLALRNWILVHPGATASSRRYPPDQFARAANALALDGFQVIFTGGRSDVDLVRAIQHAMAAPSISLAGQLTVPDLAAWIASAPLLIANNTGPVHLAAALGTPVVDLYALTNPQHTPWRVPHKVLYHDVPCRFCYKSVCPEGHHRCLTEISWTEVIGAARELLKETACTPSA